MTSIFTPNKLLLIAGPCTIESLEACQTVAEVLANLQRQYIDRLTVVFKGSFDKANRTSADSPRGVGLERGLEILSGIRQKYNLPVTTDIHLPQQAKAVAEVCDVIQIPAFLCRQTDLLSAAAETDRTVSVKKGQFLSPFDMRFVVEKLCHFGAKEIWLIERGTTFGYGNLVVDMRSFPVMRQTQCPILFDATHSLQMIGGGMNVTGGDRRFFQPLAQAALAGGAQGLFIETHPNPATAWSDQATQLPLAQLPTAIEKCLKIWECTRSTEDTEKCKTV